MMKRRDRKQRQTMAAGRAMMKSVRMSWPPRRKALRKVKPEEPENRMEQPAEEQGDERDDVVEQEPDQPELMRDDGKDLRTER